MFIRLIIILVLALNLEAGIISKAIKKVTIDKAKDIMVDKTKDKAKTKFKEKVMDNLKVKEKFNTTLTNLEKNLNKKLQENQARGLLNGQYKK